MQRFSDKFGKIWRNGIADHLVLISLGTTELEVRASEILCPWDNRSPPNGCIQ